MKKLTSHNLKNELWETLQAIKQKKLTPQMANAIARQSCELMRVARTELLIAQLSKTQRRRMKSESQKALPIPVSRRLA